MIAQSSQRRAGPGGWLPLIIAAAVYAAAIGVVAALRADGGTDFRDFWQTAQHFRQTGQISSELGVHNYLPFFTLLMTPWSVLPLRLAIVLFTLLSFGLLALTVVLVETMLNGELASRPRPALLVAVGLMLPYVHSCGVLGQVGLLLLFLIVAAWFLAWRGREWMAGAVLGLATLIKLLPGLLLVFFLLKRRWRVAGAALAVAVICGLGMPLATLGWEETIAQHRGFYRRAVQEHGPRTTILRDKPRKAKYTNNSLPIVLRRLLSPVNGDPSDSDPARKLLINFADLPRETIWIVYLALLTVLTGTSIALTAARARAWPPRDAAAAATVHAQFGLWCCLVLMAAPLLWTHYLVLAYWPLALAADRAERDSPAQPRDGPAGAATSAGPWWPRAALLAWLGGAILLAWPAARAAGAQLWSVLFLWIFAAWLAARLRHGTAGPV